MTRPAPLLAVLLALLAAPLAARATPPKIVPPTACAPSATTLCVSDKPGDARFRVEVDFFTDRNGGSSGQGRAIPLENLGVRRGGMFWFFSADNPELLVKVLDGCSQNGHFWVFWSAGTTVGRELRVTDTFTGVEAVYMNPDRQTAAPVADREAFVCDDGG